MPVSHTPTQGDRRPPQRRKLAKSGTTGRADYYRAIVRPESEFVTFRTQTSASQVASSKWMGSGTQARGLGAFP